MNNFKWGPFFWYFIHRIASYKKNKVSDVKKFYYLLPFLIPCSECKIHTIEYYKKDNYSDCESLEDLFRWSFRFHNLINIKNNKKVHFYDILKSYYGKTDHNMIYTFVSILWISKKKCKSEANIPHEYKSEANVPQEHMKYFNNKGNYNTINLIDDNQIFYNEFFKLLPSIFPCSVCKENLLLIKNKMNGYFINLLMSCHFPDNKSSVIYYNNALSSYNLKISKQDNKKNSKNPKKKEHLIICRKIPLLPNIKYKMEIEFPNENSEEKQINEKVKFSISHNRKPISFFINKKEYENFDLTKSAEIIFSLPFKFNNIHKIKMGGILKLKFQCNSNKKEKFIIKSIQIN